MGPLRPGVSFKAVKPTSLSCFSALFNISPGHRLRNPIPGPGSSDAGASHRRARGLKLLHGKPSNVAGQIEDLRISKQRDAATSVQEDDVFTLLEMALAYQVDETGETFAGVNGI